MGGLALSTLLTLFAVPLFYTYVEDFGQALERLAGFALGSGLRGRVSGPAPERSGVQDSGLTVDG
jgi:hypothetical protein